MRDRLFLMWNCPGCTIIKHRLSLLEDKTGSNGQGLTVVHTFTNGSTRDILDSFGIDGFTPSIQTYNNKILYDTDDIISYLESEGYISESV